ncbi:MAG: hypothetical protein R6T96_13815, partial [Longimicrobiales bacterium]
AVKDLTVFELISLGNDAGLTTGAVLDFRPERNGLKNEIRRVMGSGSVRKAMNVRGAWQVGQMRGKTS